jgi:hypothetical protein
MTKRELAIAKRDVLLEMHELMRPGPQRREALSALYNLSFKYGAMRDVDDMAQIGAFEPPMDDEP